jgi:[phosphatase 2A protein]-leucine-carboxy methyltransferase
VNEKARDLPPDITKYIEIDFPSVTSLKAQRISRSPRLSSLLTTSSSHPHPPPSQISNPDNRPFTVSQGGTRVDSPLYSLLPLDLRQTPRTILEKEVKPLLNPEIPVLFLGECVFCYMKPEVSAEIIGWFGGFERCIGVVYEMYGLEWVDSPCVKREVWLMWGFCIGILLVR